ncbi:hypothetical protein [Bacillus atrophaeus]|uniref:hypothetical protein n=1 Tax=Bacillus atrophaeus TaxID=1452 RepID=UPI003872A9D2
MSKKKKVIIFSAIITLIILAVAIPTYINRLDTSKLDAITTETKKDKEIDKYFNNVWMREVEDSANHEYDLSLSAKSNFKDLSDEEKLILLGKVTTTIKNNSKLNSIDCGRNKTCSINEVFVLPSEDDKTASYTIKYDPLNSPEENVLEVKKYQNDDKESMVTNITEVKLTDDIDPSEKLIQIGMSESDVLLLSDWGKPKDINKTTTSTGTNEQWVYGGNKYLYFENGELTAIQD